MSIAGIKKHFDLSIRDQIEATIKNGGSDNFFIFSGPPQFDKIGDDVTDNINAAEVGDLNVLCPLLFTTSFTQGDNRPPTGEHVSTGTGKRITAASAGMSVSGQLQIGANHPVTGRPGRGGITEDAKKEQWNFLKRLYFWLINDSDAKAKIFGEGKGFIGNEKEFPHAVAPDKYSIWGNFSKSALYTFPFGLFVVLLSNSGEPIKGSYYEGCLPLAGGPSIDVRVGSVASVSGFSGMPCSYVDVHTFSMDTVTSMIGNGTGDEALSNLNNLMMNYLND